MSSITKGLAIGSIALLALGTTGCDAIKKLIAPRLDKPTIGTRSDPLATLDVKSSTPKAKYLGCDIRFWNMPAGSKLKVSWAIYESEDSNKPKRETAGEDQPVQGSGIINGHLSHEDGYFPPGIYECRWEAISEKKVEGGKQAAKITVADVSEKKGDDDAEEAPKKKKKKSKDDDE
jgi:hypothetical protein